MRSIFSQFVVLASLVTIPAAVQGQTTTPADSTTPTASATGSSLTSTVVSPNSHKSVDKDKKGKSKKDIEAEEKKTLFNTKIHDGVLNVDGMTAKIHLDYELNGERYLYFYVPGEGTAVVAREEMPGAKKLDKAFDRGKLAFSTGGHDFMLESKENLLGKGTDDAYIRFDNSEQAKAMGNYPMMGFGKIPLAPYAWPAADQAAPQEAKDAKAPPVPTYMLPKRVNLSGAAAPAPATTTTPAPTAPATDSK